MKYFEYQGRAIVYTRSECELVHSFYFYFYFYFGVLVFLLPAALVFSFKVQKSVQPQLKYRLVTSSAAEENLTRYSKQNFVLSFGVFRVAIQSSVDLC